MFMRPPPMPRLPIAADCPKCGHDFATARYLPATDQLERVCTACDYEWREQTKETAR